MTYRHFPKKQLFTQELHPLEAIGARIHTDRRTRVCTVRSRMHASDASGERVASVARERGTEEKERRRKGEKREAERGRRKKASGAFIARLRSQRLAGWCPPPHARYTSRGAASSARRSALGAG